jgi:NAD(P)-dependent dehydrogenase (short-subunit alcohol dehydrogenase family)
MTRRRKKIRDKVVAITGGARGIGKAMAKRF